ncbi:FtsW/RodA/SpoVE family cell cycle protein [Natronosporangium hydrolyticum]|uniref:FtsW/RodA/SpoVE family cell cycle protein n=1 Tax=Natronosporangium hydrolyticum TaxID=2811111 RepID=A0A895YRZ1_9ACTN|nr:FtsW/RodA/SpoVE family cell cycle protein [Natronosporangium hydrolyticum]
MPVPPSSRSSTGRGRASRNPRNAELGLLLLAMGVIAGFSATVELQLLDTLSASFWVQPAVLTVTFLVAHVALRIFAPYADPVLLPAVALLNGVGVAFLRRLDLGVTNPDDVGEGASPFSGIGGSQLIWTAVSIAGVVGVLWLVRDHRLISRYAWTLGLVGIVLMIIPGLLPASISASEYDESAKLWIRIGPFSIQPGEFAKLALLCFFAYYLVRKREVLSLAGKRFLGIDFPRGRDLGPVVVVWLLSLLVLVMQFDLGMSLMYLGMFVAMLYIATERISWMIIGFLLFTGGAVLAYVLGSTIGGPFYNFSWRVDVWLDPFADPTGAGYQPLQSLLGLGTGGLFGTGPGAGQPTQVPEVHNDFIFAGIGEEIGLFGLTALLMVLLVVVTRGIRIGLAVRDSFGKLLAGGLAFTLGLQIFVILGGVTGLIPLTGLTTPLMSAGGSALMSNWILVALLLRISDAARQPATPPVVSSPMPARPGAERSGAERPGAERPGADRSGAQHHPAPGGGQGAPDGGAAPPGRGLADGQAAQKGWSE